MSDFISYKYSVRLAIPVSPYLEGLCDTFYRGTASFE